MVGEDAPARYGGAVHGLGSSEEIEATWRYWAKSEAELGERWSKELKWKTLRGMIERAPGTDSFFIKRTQAEVRKDLAKAFAAAPARLGVTGPLERAATFINAVTRVYDPHTVYLAPAVKRWFEARWQGHGKAVGSLEGIGAVLSAHEHHVRVDGAIRLARGQVFRPSGASTQWRGVVPDIVLPGRPSHEGTSPCKFGRSVGRYAERQRENSIPWSSGRPLRFQRWRRAPWDRRPVNETAAREGPTLGALSISGARPRSASHRRGCGPYRGEGRGSTGIARGACRLPC